MDTSELHELIELLGAEDVVQLLDIFLGESLSQVGVIYDYLKVGDMDAVHRSAHTLKGSAMNMGARGLANACADLEHAENPDAATAPFVRVQAMAKEVRQVFEAERKALLLAAAG